MFANKWLLWAVVYGFVLTFLALYLPGLNKALGIEPLNFWEWLLVLGVGILAMLWVEVVKFFSNRNRNEKVVKD